MRKRTKLFLSVVLVITMIFASGLLLKNNNKQSISTILSKRSYAYLPAEAKEYIEKVYEETGEVVKTEKNKEDNEPYLNPKYIEYLELSDEEKEKVELIPDIYVLDYEVNKSYSTPTLPSSYDLRNVDGKNYVSSIKNQESTGICWAFASVENVETLLMKQSGQSYSDQTQKFSIRQMDYATSTNRLIKSYVNSGTVSCTPVESCSYYPWKNPDNGSRELGKGGNFFTSSIVMANGLTLVDESILPWNDDDHTYWPKDIFSYENSLYEVNSTIQMPTINENSVSEDLINSYVNDVKNYMIQYGGPFVGTYSPKSTCGFDNTDGTKAMKTDDCVNDTSNKDLGHAMQIIGWDDNYEYSYCDAGTKHYAVKNGSCTSGELTQGKGAWILRNSWGVESEEGNAYKYLYLTYDSTRLSIGFTTSVSEMANRSWDNNYHSNPWIESNISNGMASVSEQTKEFDTHNNKAEKIEKVKFVTASKNGKFKLSIITEDKEYNNIATVNSNEVGVYTVDLSNKNIILTDNNFSVKIIGENDDKFYNDSISVFTSNTTSEPYLITYKNDSVLSYDNPLNVNLTDKIGENDKFTFTIYQKNIPSNSVVDFKIVKLGEETTSSKNVNGYTPKRQIYLDKQVFEFEINEYYYFHEGNGPYVFQLLVNDTVVDTFPIVRSGTANYINASYSDIKLHANNGTDHYETINVKNETYHKFDNEDINNSNFFNDYHYIVGWNTKADGTGTSYPVDKNFLIMQDMDLYAQWSADTVNSVNVEFDCQQYSSCYGINGTVESQTVEYNKKIIMPDNNYVRNGYKFSRWRLSSGGYYMDFYEGQSSYYTASYYIKYPVYNNLSIRAYAIWIEEDNAIEISFDSNGGTGNMKSINVQKALSNGDLVNHTIKENDFSRPGYAFTGWNTKADGTGTSYNDKGTIQSDSDVKLYAQWEVANKYTVTFYANDGSNNSATQGMPDLINTKLKKNEFTKTGYTFTGWNTNANGTGTAYANEQSVSLSNDLTLYAQWEINKYTITFNSNGGTGTLNPQQVSYNTPTKLSKNTFTKDGFKFAGWNTKADGTGTLYTNEQNVSLSDNLTLYAQWSEGDPYVINEYNYDEDNNYVSNIDVNTTVDAYKQNIELLGGYTVEVDYKTIDNKQVLYTGGKTRIYKNQTLYAELTNVVSGDTNGDGKINYLDYVNVYNHIQKTKHPENNKKLLVDEFLSAADMSKDNKISYLDYVRIYNKIKELKGGSN